MKEKIFHARLTASDQATANKANKPHRSLARMRRQIQGFFQRNKKILIIFGMGHDFRIAPGIGPDHLLCFAFFANRYCRLDGIPVIHLCCRNASQREISLIHNKSRNLKCRNSYPHDFGFIHRIKIACLVTALLQPAFIAVIKYTIPCRGIASGQNRYRPKSGPPPATEPPQPGTSALTPLLLVA